MPPYTARWQVAPRSFYAGIPQVCRRLDDHPPPHLSRRVSTASLLDPPFIFSTLLELSLHSGRSILPTRARYRGSERTGSSEGYRRQRTSSTSWLERAFSR